MITLFFCWIYTTAICLCWGNMLLGILKKASREPKPETGFSITCFAGLAVVGVVALGISIFLPLDWKAHCLIVLPVLIFCLYPSNRKTIQIQVSSGYTGFSKTGYCLLFVCTAMVLAIGSHKIIHPDTLAYHAQAIEWFQKYRAVPGIAHIKQELGLQSAWFAASAIFNPFGPVTHFFFLGSVVLCWYLVFIIKKTGSIFVEKHSGAPLPAASLGWLLLFIYTLFSWTQLRLTAASASPDFIVTLYILCVVYVYLEKPADGSGHFYLFLGVFFCCAAVMTKLSALAIMGLLLVIFVGLLWKRCYRPFLTFAVLVGLMIAPLLVRNYIASGYLLYPSSIPDWFNPDWKYSLENLHKFQHYITAYARYSLDVTGVEVSTNAFTFQWVPGWWKHLATADQLLLCSIVIALFANLGFLKLISLRSPRRGLVVLIISIAGCLLWFFKAPDPRFGSGFLLALVAVLYLPFTREPFFNSVAGRITGAVSWLVLLLVTGYTIYRFAFFFAPSEIIYPAGIQRVNYTERNDMPIKIYQVSDSAGCGLTPVPCISDSSLPFVPRGNSITDGFKAK